MLNPNEASRAIGILLDNALFNQIKLWSFPSIEIMIDTVEGVCIYQNADLIISWDDTSPETLISAMTIFNRLEHLTPKNRQEYIKMLQDSD